MSSQKKTWTASGNIERASPAGIWWAGQDVTNASSKHITPMDSLMTYVNHAIDKCNLVQLSAVLSCTFSLALYMHSSSNIDLSMQQPAGRRPVAFPSHATCQSNDARLGRSSNNDFSNGMSRMHCEYSMHAAHVTARPAFYEHNATLSRRTLILITESTRVIDKC